MTEERCPHCGAEDSTSRATMESELVCLECGKVVEEKVISSEVRRISCPLQDGVACDPDCALYYKRMKECSILTIATTIHIKGDQFLGTLKRMR